MKLLILAGGKGGRLWPYGQVRNKTMIPISNIPIAQHLVNAAWNSGISEVFIVAVSGVADLKALFQGQEKVHILSMPASAGTAESLLFTREYLQDEPFMVVYGDTIIDSEDLKTFVQTAKPNTVLLSPCSLPQIRQENVSCSLGECGLVKSIRIASRSVSYTHTIHAYCLSPAIFEEIERTPVYFEDLNVGVMPTSERYLSGVLSHNLTHGAQVESICAKHPVFDVNKPWDILRANHAVNAKRTAALKKTTLGNGSSIADSARIDGFVSLGDHSHIGEGVVIRGNVIIGDNTMIQNGAIIEGGTVIGDGASIQNYCIIGSGDKGNTTIGNQCILDHGCEIYNSVLMEKVSFAHFSEFSGIVGRNTDIAAGTLIGSLRFDDQMTRQEVNGHRESPQAFGNAVFIGDYNRTGVGAMLMPGVKTGVYCVTGSGVLLDRDLPDRKLIYTKQETAMMDWGPEKYGL